MSPKAYAHIRVGDMDRQFASAWRRTREHDNWSPRSLPSGLPHPVKKNEKK
ncbi:hypothetical protein Bca4012_043533 [Brassica carinata]